MSHRHHRFRKPGVSGRAAGLLALCAPLLAATPAFSQNPTAQATNGTSAATGTLQEVVVTAERRATNIQTTPISIQAISGVQLQTQGITSVQNLNQVAPNLTVTQNGLLQEVNIRGIGIEAAGGDGQNGVLIVHDGLPNNADGVGLNAPYYDIADVEVLRGPQGTFAGDNSTGGAIIINSENPNFRGANGYFDGTVATYSEKKFQGAMNLPVNDTLALRFAFNEETRGSFFYDEGAAFDGPYLGGPHFIPGSAPSTVKTSIDPGNVNDKDGRLSILWNATPNLQSLTKIEMDVDNSQGVPQQPNTAYFTALPGLPCPSGTASKVAGYCQDKYASGYSGSPYVLNNWDTNLQANQEIDYYSEQLNYTLPGGVVLRSISGDQEINVYQNSSRSNDSINDGFNTGSQTVHTMSEEIDALSPTTGNFSWIAGANWSFNKEKFAAYNQNYGPPFSVSAPQITLWNHEQLWVKSEGVYGQISWQFTPTLQLQVGARENWDQEPSHQGGIAIIQPPPYHSFLSHNSIGYSTSGEPTGKIGINWTPRPGQFFYAFVARGYKPGENNLGSAPPAKKETVNDYELGWKGRLADGHVLTQVGGYYMQYMGMIEHIFDASNVHNSASGNVPFSIVKGIEASMQSRVGGLGVDVDVALNKSILGPLVTSAQYKFPSDYGLTNQCAPGVSPLPGNTNCTNYTPFIENLSGEALPYAPLFTAHATIDYAIPIGNMTVQPRVVYSYQSKSYASLFQSDSYYLLPARGLWNGYVDWDAGPWTVTVFGTNLADRVYLTGLGFYGDPRQVGLEVRRDF
jgi:iron complex outermembrane recepter protein